MLEANAPHRPGAYEPLVNPDSKAAKRVSKSIEQDFLTTVKTGVPTMSSFGCGFSRRTLFPSNHSFDLAGMLTRAV